MRKSLSRIAIALGVLLAAATRPVFADTHSWTLCTPGSFHSCHSVALITTPVMTGDLRTGTQVTIQVANLQGSSPHDNTPWSRFVEVFFWMPPEAQQVQPFYDAYPWVAGSPSGGASGNASGVFAQVNLPGVGTYFYLSGLALGGCNQAHGLPSYTCGDGVFSFSLSTPVLADAAAFTTIEITAYDEQGGSHMCFSDPDAFGPSPGHPACDVVSETTVPEPLTVLLVGTGLAGIGGLRRRRAL